MEELFQSFAAYMAASFKSHIAGSRNIPLSSGWSDPGCNDDTRDPALRFRESDSDNEEHPDHGSSFKFENKKTTLETILAFEEAIDVYEKASGDLVPDDLKISIILSHQECQLRQHMSMNITPKTTYPKLRQFLLSYEQNIRWTTTDLISPGKDHVSQADMDIGRVKGKGKDGRGKGKSNKGLKLTYHG